MALTPQITLTGTAGGLGGAADAGATLVITLVNYGALLPSVPGTAMISGVGPNSLVLAAGTFSVSLWGNDVIAPFGTLYNITLLDDGKNIIQSADYSFTGTETVDLSNATPASP